MSRVSRSDWSASTPWLNITGKPNFGTATDVGALTAAGFAPGQIARWNGTKFVPFTIPAPSAPVNPVNPLPDPAYFTWDTPSLAPLQTATENFPLIGAIPGEPIAFGISFDPGFCWVSAVVFANDLVQLRVMNMDLVTVDLGVGVWAIQRMTT